MRGLKLIHEGNVLEKQAGLHPSQGCIHQTFTFCRLFEIHHEHRRSTIMILLDLNNAFDPVSRTALFNILDRKDILKNFVNLI